MSKIIMISEENAEENLDSDLVEGVSASTETIIPKSLQEIGGRDGPEPTRFGDWEKKGRCIDF